VEDMNARASQAIHAPSLRDAPVMTTHASDVPSAGSSLSKPANGCEAALSLSAHGVRISNGEQLLCSRRHEWLASGGCWRR
jgi:hypothetical protein